MICTYIIYMCKYILVHIHFWVKNGANCVHDVLSWGRFIPRCWQLSRNWWGEYIHSNLRLFWFHICQSHGFSLLKEGRFLQVQVTTMKWEYRSRFVSKGWSSKGWSSIVHVGPRIAFESLGVGKGIPLGSTYKYREGVVDWWKGWWWLITPALKNTSFCNRIRRG